MDRIHPVKVAGYPGRNFDLGVEISRMRYDQVLEVFEGMRSGFESQAKNDHDRLKRFRLSKLLSKLTGEISQAMNSLREIFALCKPYLKHELEEDKNDRPSA